MEANYYYIYTSLTASIMYDKISFLMASFLERSYNKTVWKCNDTNNFFAIRANIGDGLDNHIHITPKIDLKLSSLLLRYMFNRFRFRFRYFIQHNTVKFIIQ